MSHEATFPEVLPEGLVTERARTGSGGAKRRSMTIVALAAMLGAGAAFATALSVPRHFAAETRLKVQDATEATISTAMSSLRSERTLDNLARALDLSSDSEFSAHRSGGTGLIMDLLTGEPLTVSEAEARMRERLSQAIESRYDKGAGELSIYATAGSPERASSIANILAERFVQAVTLAGAGSADPVLEKLRQTLDRAEAALSGFVTQFGEHKIAALRSTHAADEQLAGKITEAENRLAELKGKLASASLMKPEDVLSKVLPDSLEYTGLDYQRQRHVDAKLLVDRLAAELGPRHPRLLAARSALAEIRSDITKALAQLVGSLRQQEESAVRQLTALRNENAKTAKDDATVRVAARLAELEVAVDEARRNYLRALDGAGPGMSSAVRLDILKPASAERTEVIGPSPSRWAGAGGALGACLGFMYLFFARTRQDEGFGATEEDLWVEPDWSWPGGQAEGATQLAMDETETFQDCPPITQPRRHPPDGQSATPYASLGDQITELLLANRRPPREAGLPPLVSAVLSGRVAAASTEAATGAARSYVHGVEEETAKEVEALRRHMAELRERVRSYSAGGRGFAA